MLAGLLLAFLAADFRSQIRPILEGACFGCHGPDKALGGFRVDSSEMIRKALVPGDPFKSSLLQRVMRGPNEPGAMPPGGPPLRKEQIEVLRAWIQEGAAWPTGVTVRPPQPKRLDDLKLTADIHRRIAAGSTSGREADMKAYRITIARSDVSFEMVPVPGGEFQMGTPDSESGRARDEGPTHTVTLEPFWMSAREVTWDEYRLFMFAGDSQDPLIDAVSHPTRPYVEMSFGMGISGYPAISMTQHAANKYGQWLSSTTGHFYRLPTEAEWEYACRAGTRTAYSFGDDAARLGEFAWFSANSGDKYAKVGAKKPNPWGLYDMHGNVMEWTLDGYSEDFYPKSPRVMPWSKPTNPYPHSVRGGSWNDGAEKCRCGARVASDSSWKMQDPQLPKSIWYHTDAQWLGFRLVRPLKLPTAEAMHAYWNNGVEGE
jgi:formylglycine-generating enzyme required for sulfatase activity